MDGLTQRRAAAIAIAAGLCWRLAAAWPAGDAALPYVVPQEEYFLSSVMLRSEGVYASDPGGGPRTGHGPLYTTFLAAVQAGGRPSPRRARMAQAALGALGALAAWGLGAALLSPAAGALAAAFVSLDPSLAASARDLDVHGFYGLVLLLLACAAAWWAERDGDRPSGNLLGLALGTSLLCRSAHLASAPLIAAAAFAWWGRSGLRRAARVLLIAAAVLVPWTVRNYIHTGHVIPLDAGTGAYNLIAAADGGDHAVRIDEAFAIAERRSPGFGAAHLDQPIELREAALVRLARRMILEAPGDYARGCARRLAAFWLSLWPFLLPALYAALRRDASRGVKAAALIAASLSAYAAIGQGVGYTLAAEPLLAALAGIGAAALAGRPAKRGSPAAWRAAFPLGAAIAATAVLCALLTPLDAMASRRAGRPDCGPPAAPIAAFLDDGVRLAGEGWYLAPWAGTLRARPDVCAGMAAFSSGDPAAAARSFDAAAALAPRDPEIRVSLAVALGAAGDRKRALRECEAAEALATSSAPRGERARLLESIRSTRAHLVKR